MKKPSTRVAILLSTFNGAAYVHELMHSLMGQSHDEWILYWRDDGSTDETRNLFAVAGLPDDRVVTVTGDQRMGVTGSFMTLLRQAYADGHVLFAFADQDDIWLSEKLKWAVDVLNGVPCGVPGLYFTRQVLVDARLRRLALSFPLHRPAGFLAAVTQNQAAGCTIVMNQAAAALIAGSEPPSICLHDWWSYIVVAASGGALLPDTRPTVLYRQHGANFVGAPRTVLRRGIGALRRGPGPYMRRLHAVVNALAAQPALLSPPSRIQVDQLARALQAGWREKLQLIRSMPQFRRQGWLETMVLWIWFLLPPCRPLETGQAADPHSSLPDSFATVNGRVRTGWW
jgi:hypothetical protein